jgi:hypothetical protein
LDAKATPLAATAMSAARRAPARAAIGGGDRPPGERGRGRRRRIGRAQAFPRLAVLSGVNTRKGGAQVVWDSGRKARRW